MLFGINRNIDEPDMTLLYLVCFICILILANRFLNLYILNILNKYKTQLLHFIYFDSANDIHENIKYGTI